MQRATITAARLGTGALALAALSVAACTYSENTANIQGQDVHLTVLHTADVHSRVLPYNFTPNKFDEDDGVLPPLAPFGGAARLKTLLDRERAKATRVIHVDSGDCFEGAPIFSAFKGEVEFRAMSALGVDVAALGNHEFDKGPYNLQTQIATWAGFPILAANYMFNDPGVAGGNQLGDMIKPYVILDADGLKVGVIGMGNVSSISQLVQGGNSLGITPLDTDQTVEYYADLIRPMSDIVVAVSHLGLDEDEDTATTNSGLQAATATQVRGDVDVVFGGHLHIVLNPPKEVPIYAQAADGTYQPTNRNTVLVHSGAFAKTFGRLDLVVHVNTPEEMAAQYEANKAVALSLNQPIPEPRRGYVKAYDYKVIPVTAREPVDGEMCVTPNEDSSGQTCTPTQIPTTDGSLQYSQSAGFCQVLGKDGQRVPCTGASTDCTDPGDQCNACIYCHIPEDGFVENIVEPYALQMNASSGFELTRVFANVAVTPTSSGTTTGGILRNNPDGADSQLGNLVASAMQLQAEVQADFSMTNSLGIRADLSPGPLSIEQMTNVMPFDNTIEVVYLTGSEIQQMFDFISAKSATRGCKTQAQVAGLAYVMDCNVPPHTWTAEPLSGQPCNPALYQDAENLGNCYQGAADLILIGSQRECNTDADCTVAGGGENNETCGTSLGMCLNPGGTCLNQTNFGASSRMVCDPSSISTICPAMEQCTENLSSHQTCSVADPTNTCPSSEQCVPSELHACGKLLNPEGSYRVAVNDYVAAGGSGFTDLQYLTSKYNTGISLRAALIDYLQRLDDPSYAGGYGCNGTPGEYTCYGAIRCNDPRWSATNPNGTPVDPYLATARAISTADTYQYCPGETNVDQCPALANLICILPHNQIIDGRIEPRFQ